METFAGTINDNFDVVFRDKYYCLQFLEKYIGKDIEIELRFESKKRSDKQNRAYWGLAINTIIKQTKELTGEEYTKEDIHYYVLKNVIEVKLDMKKIMGENVITYTSKSTSQMNTKEFNQFWEKLQKHFAEREIIIPDPGQIQFL